MTAAPDRERGRAPRAHVDALTAASGSRGFITACLALVAATSRRSERVGTKRAPGGSARGIVGSLTARAWRGARHRSSSLRRRPSCRARLDRPDLQETILAGLARLASRSPPRRWLKSSPPATLARLPPMKGLPRPTRLRRSLRTSSGSGRSRLLLSAETCTVRRATRPVAHRSLGRRPGASGRLPLLAKEQRASCAGCRDGLAVSRVMLLAKLSDCPISADVRPACPVSCRPLRRAGEAGSVAPWLDRQPAPSRTPPTRPPQLICIRVDHILDVSTDPRPAAQNRRLETAPRSAMSAVISLSGSTGWGGIDSGGRARSMVAVPQTQGSARRAKKEPGHEYVPPILPAHVRRLGRWSWRRFLSVRTGLGHGRTGGVGADPGRHARPGRRSEVSRRRC